MAGFSEPVPKLKHHIAGKPVGLMAGLMSIMDGPILDPFMGSGTVGLACAELGLDYIGIEVEPAYFEIACKRLAELECGGPRRKLDQEGLLSTQSGHAVVRLDAQMTAPDALMSFRSRTGQRCAGRHIVVVVCRRSACPASRGPIEAEV